MKIIVTGATGLVGSEVIRQALYNKAITSIIALARKPVPVPSRIPPDADTSKLKSLILEDWLAPYPKHILDECAGAAGLIWLLAVTPSKSAGMDFAEVTRICHDYTVHCLEQLFPITANPFRIIYMSGIVAERDQNKIPPAMPEHALMRGRCENSVVAFAAKHAPRVEATTPKPGFIRGPGREEMEKEIQKRWAGVGVPYASVHVSELAAVSIAQCVNGIKKDSLLNDEVVEMSKSVMAADDYL